MYNDPNQQPGGPNDPYYLPGSSNSPSLGQANFPSPLYFDTAFSDSPSTFQSLGRLSPSTHTLQSTQPTSEYQSYQSTAQSSAQSIGPDPSPRQAQRVLPSREVSAETMTDAFVDFILYCNPQFGSDTNAAALRANFNKPPRSDDKEFETWDLWLLLQRFDAKEIKTWGQLALELGVSPPDAAKGQSAQKVQQYTVRLKRWMHAMHIDAFFEFLLGKEHRYFTDLPPASDPYPSSGRDGVPAEEDLAIRALDPAFRPKRGRRRNSDADQDVDASTEGGDKQSHLALPGQVHSALPQSAHPDRFSHDPWAIASAVTPQTFAPWAGGNAGAQTAVATTAPSHLRWHLHDPAQNPSTPHPMTAHPLEVGHDLLYVPAIGGISSNVDLANMYQSMNEQMDSPFGHEPQSAITPARKRRRHYPAVSSAWPSTNTPGAKPRGRPPATRNIQDGPFGTFPSRPASERPLNVPSRDLSRSVSDLHVNTAEQPGSMPPPSALPKGSSPPAANMKPKRLSLQVPQIVGGPVRLATPPPTLLVTTESDADDTNSELTRSRSAPELPAFDQASTQPMAPPQQPSSMTHQVSNQDQGGHTFGFEVLKRVLTSDLLRAELVGRPKRLSGDEAKKLADAMLQRLNVPRADTEDQRSTISRLTAASWLGVGHQLNVPLGPASSPGKTITVTFFRMSIDGYEEPVSARDPDFPLTSHAESTRSGLREVFNVSWKASQGLVTGAFEIRDITLDPAPLRPVFDEDSHDRILATMADFAAGPRTELDEWVKERMTEAAIQRGGPRPGDDGVNWKARAMAWELSMQLARGELERNRKAMLEKVLDVLV